MLDLITFLDQPSSAMQLPLDLLPSKIMQRMDAIALMDATRRQAIKTGTPEAYRLLVELYERAGLPYCADWARTQAGEERVHVDIGFRHRKPYLKKLDREGEILKTIADSMPKGITRKQLADKLNICITTADNWTRYLRVSGRIVSEGARSCNSVYKLATP